MLDCTVIVRCSETVIDCTACMFYILHFLCDSISLYGNKDIYLFTFAARKNFLKVSIEHAGMHALSPVAKLAVMLVMLGMSKILSKNTFFQNIKLLFKILNVLF